MVIKGPNMLSSWFNVGLDWIGFGFCWFELVFTEQLDLTNSLNIQLIKSLIT